MGRSDRAGPSGGATPIGCYRHARTVLKLQVTRPVAVANQLVGVWVLGSLVLPLAVGLLLVLAYAGGGGAVVVGAVVALVGCVAYLGVVIAATREASFLGAGVGGRSVWVGLVSGLGTAGWVLGWAITDAAGFDVAGRPFLIALTGGLPFVLVAGLLVRGWRVNAVALALTLVLVVGGSAALSGSGPDEVTERLQANPTMTRQTIYVVRIPGYHPAGQPYGDDLGTGDFVPDDPAVIPPDRSITVVAYGPEELTPADGNCGPVARDSRLWTLSDCTTEPDGLVFRDSAAIHGYQVKMGDVYVVVSGSKAVDRTVLHTLAATLRLATAAELGDTVQGGGYFIGTAPGYTGQLMGIPPRMQYTLTDNASGLMGVFISVYAYRVGASDPCSGAPCQPDGDGLLFIRGTDGIQTYVSRRDDADVYVRGGALVDRGLVRRTAQQARLATGAEIVRGLSPSKPTRPLDRLRQWLRDAF
jgi:hypothetical protein